MYRTNFNFTPSLSVSQFHEKALRPNNVPKMCITNGKCRCHETKVCFDGHVSFFSLVHQGMNTRIIMVNVHLVQRTIFRRGKHISPHFTIMMILNVLKQMAISLNRLGKAYLDSIGIKEKKCFFEK